MHRVGYALTAGLVAAVSVPATALASIASLPVVRGGTGADVVVPVAVSPAGGVTAIELLFSFDPAVVHATGVYRTGFGNAFAIDAGASTPGEVDVALTSPAPLSGSGAVAWIAFRVLGGSGAASDLTWLSARPNGGAIPATTQNGRLTVSNGPTRFELRDTEGGPSGAQRAVPPLVQSLSGADGIDLVVRFNQNVFSAVVVEKASLSEPFNPTHNVGVPGQASISLGAPPRRLAGTGVTGAAAPSTGSAFWYLVRPVNCGRAGAFDSGGPGQQGPRDPGIAASVGYCP